MQHSTPSFFFFNDTATTEIYTLSLHDALPIFMCQRPVLVGTGPWALASVLRSASNIRWRIAMTSRRVWSDRKSTRLNSSHSQISYAVFCLKKKKTLYKSFLLPDKHESIALLTT